MALKLLALPLVVAILAAGVWFWSGVVAPGYWSAIVLGVAWFVACSVIFGRVGRARPELRPWVRGPFLACCVAAAAGFYWTSVRDTVVDERVVTGVPASSAASGASADRPGSGRAGDQRAPGSARRAAAPPRGRGVNVVELAGPVRPQSHSGSGTARVVRLAAGGRRLTLSGGFEIDPGPQVRVYLATDSSAAAFEDVGALKGSKGSQQYAIPAGVDLARYDTVVFWCVPFSQTLASATLKPA